MMRNFMIPEIESKGLVQDFWFQQDGATSHMARETMTLLRERFQGHLISRFGDVPWTPRSPDLTPADFFFWSYIKSKVYITKPRNLNELKTRITHETSLISAESLRKVMEEAVKRSHTCLSFNARHLKYKIFKK